MELTKVKFEYVAASKKNSGIPAIIVAAGSSTRMGGANKQLMILGGIPVLARTLLAFEACDAVSDIILVVKPEDVFEIQMMTEKYMINKLTDIICGGKTRIESVKKGFSRLDKTTKYVLIHDGARPFVDNNIITSVATALKDHEAVTCAVKVKDTIKQVDKSGKVLKTIKRESLVAVQTPQGVDIEKYREALENASDTDSFTDDMSVMEAAGYEVFTVPGSYNNIKITTPEDLVIGGAIISEGEE